jgi:hypothetical protein
MPKVDERIQALEAKVKQLNGWLASALTRADDRALFGLDGEA